MSHDMDKLNKLYEAQNLPPDLLEYLVEQMIEQKYGSFKHEDKTQQYILFKLAQHIFKEKKDYSKTTVVSFFAQVEALERNENLVSLYGSLITEFFDLLKKEIKDEAFISEILNPVFQLVKTLDEIGLYFVKHVLKMSFDIGFHCPDSKSKCLNFLFQNYCKEAKTANDLQKVIKMIEQRDELFGRMIFKSIYNQFIGWAVPCSKALKVICDQWSVHVRKFPTARLIDYGAGTGVYCCLLEQMGIQADRMIALDLPVKTHITCRQFFPITKVIDGDFQFQPTDFVLIAWGYGQKLNPCIDAGVQCVVIQGEDSDGCTFPVNFFVDNTDIKQKWETVMHLDVCSLAASSECISVNTLY